MTTFFARVGVFLVAVAFLSNAASADEAVQSVVAAGASNGSYTLSLLLNDGRQLNLQIPPSEAVKIVDGFSKPLAQNDQKQQIVTLVRGISIRADNSGRAVVLLPTGAQGQLAPLAIPLSGADAFIAAFQKGVEDAKVNAAKQK